MNLALLAPLGLAALAAVLLPILLHLARRTPQRRTPFAALRWLSARLRPRRRVRLEEPWLLLLRVLLVACVALLFARPVWTHRDAGAPWVLVDTTLSTDAARAALTDTQDDADAQWHWLAPGFPPLGASPPVGPQPLSSLLREADATLPTATRLTVLVPRALDGLDAERPQLARAVRWAVVDAAEPPPTLAKPSPPPRVAVRGAEDAIGRRFLLAAARANGWRLDVAPAMDKPPPQTYAVFWLDAGPPPDSLFEWARQGGTLWLPDGASTPLAETRAAWRDDAGEVIASSSSLGRGRLLQWQAPLRPEALPILLEPDFARGLDVVLRATASPARADADALRPRTGARAIAPPPRPLDPWLAWLAIALFAAERLVATRAGRSAEA